MWLSAFDFVDNMKFVVGCKILFNNNSIKFIFVIYILFVLPLPWWKLLSLCTEARRLVWLIKSRDNINVSGSTADTVVRHDKIYTIISCHSFGVSRYSISAMISGQLLRKNLYCLIKIIKSVYLLFCHTTLTLWIEIDGVPLHNLSSTNMDNMDCCR